MTTTQSVPASDLQESVWVLGLFNQKVARLETHSFRAYYNKYGLRYSGKLDGDIWRWEWNAPDQDSTESFMLTFRMFYQDHDEISLSRLAKRYQTLPISPERRQKFANSYNAYKRFLKAKSTLVSGPVQHSRRAVLDMILYGDLAHVTPEQRRKIEPWLANDGCRAILATRSAEILEAIVKHLVSCRDFNQATLAELAKLPEAQGPST